LPDVADLVNEFCSLEWTVVEIGRGVGLKVLSLLEGPDTQEGVSIVGRENAIEKMEKCLVYRWIILILMENTAELTLEGVAGVFKVWVRAL
jgi:hypothetical protein